MSKKQSFLVKDGQRFLRVSRHAKGWRFAYEERDGRRRFVTRAKRVDIEEAAEEVLREMGTGLVWSGLDRDSQRFAEDVLGLVPVEDRGEALAMLRANLTGDAVEDAARRFVAHKEEEAGVRTRYIVQVDGLLKELAAVHGSSMVSRVTAAELEAWWRARGAGLSAKSRREYRSILVSFWAWCQRQGIAGNDPVTAAARLPSPKVGHGSRRVLSPAELVAVMNEVEEEWRAWVVLGAFAGLRPEEIAVHPQSAVGGKRSLHCEEIDWRFGVIRVPAEVSKVRTPRNVPMCETLRAGLEWAGIKSGMTGPVVLENPTHKLETKRLGKVVFGDGWPQDALRHSFGSYRNAQVRNLPQVAEEMGTSVGMLNRHYHNPRTEEEAAAWFGVVQEPGSSQNPGVWRVSDDDSPEIKGRKIKGKRA